MNKRQREKIEEMIAELEQIQEEEQEKYDNAPEGLEDTDRVLRFQENADNLQEAIDILQEVIA